MDHVTRIRNVTAVLGPTNTGKTHLAIERMLDHETGMIGLPLRLLAREVYDKIVQRVGKSSVALITGEEKIKPESARYWVCTVEAMPRDIDVDFLAIDEIQLAADPERGHVFTHRLLNMRGKLETLVLGAGTMREIISDIIPGSNFIARPRLSKLTYAGQKKITRLPARSAIVAFSASDVYAIAELVRRQRGGAAVVLGALSPRTRNAQVALYQSGDVDYLVATDAVGMGLNLDVDHVAFSAIRKFDGVKHRNLTPAELGQIAGRAGRHLNDGTFGVTGDVEPLEADLIERLESHTFDPLRVLQWRGDTLDFTSVERLRDSLRQLPESPRLVRARTAEDLEALENVARDPSVLAAASSPANVAKLWEVCQIPDYRKISSHSHAELVATVYGFLMGQDGVIDEDWFAKQVAYSDKTDGDIDTLSNRLAHIRTWTFVANREDWLRDPDHWQGRARAIEDSLSDALHERLTQRFVDARTSALMKGLKAEDDLVADIGEDGAITVENHYVGQLVGFHFSQATDVEGVHKKAARSAAAQVLSKELSMRVRRVSAAKDDAFRLQTSGRILWRNEPIGQLEPGEDPLKPLVTVLADEHLQPADKDRVQERLNTWIASTIADKLKPLVGLAQSADITGLAKGIAFQLTENLGVLRREAAAAEIKSLDQTARAQLRRYGVRFGAFNLFMPMLLKPAAAELLLALWCLKHGEQHGLDRVALPEAPRAGLTSVAVDPAVPTEFYQAYGFHVCGPRAVRIDILERLADLIRPLLSWRASEDKPEPPTGSTGDGAFLVTPDMMSILGCSPDELGHVLRALGFQSETRPAPESRAASSEPKEVQPANQPKSAMPMAEPSVAHENTNGQVPSDGPADQSESSPAEAADTDASNDAAAVAGAAQQDEASGEGVATPLTIASELAAAASSVSPSPGDAVASATVAMVDDDDEAKKAVSPSGETVNNATGPVTDPASADTTPVVSIPANEAGADAADSAAADDVSTMEPDQSATEIVAEAATAATIEVWRPRRRHQEPRRRRRVRRQSGPDQAAGTDAKSQDDTGAGSAKRRSRSHNRTNGPSRGGQSQGERHHKGKSDGGSGKRGPRHGKDDRSGGRGGARPRVHSSSPSKSRGADPDSPFAALSALKQAMDSREKDQK